MKTLEKRYWRHCIDFGMAIDAAILDGIDHSLVVVGKGTILNALITAIARPVLSIICTKHDRDNIPRSIKEPLVIFMIDICRICIRRIRQHCFATFAKVGHDVCVLAIPKIQKGLEASRPVNDTRAITFGDRVTDTCNLNGSCCLAGGRRQCSHSSACRAATGDIPRIAIWLAGGSRGEDACAISSAAICRGTRRITCDCLRTSGSPDHRIVVTAACSSRDICNNLIL